MADTQAASAEAEAEPSFASILDAVADLAAGRMLVVVDDADRENEGDVVCAAEMVTPEIVNFMATYGRGLVCTPMTGQVLDRLEIGQMVAENTDSHETAFCVAVDAVTNSTGISAADRSDTIRALVEPSSVADDFRRPGHTFPLRYTEGGVLRRAGHTEAAVDLAELADLRPAGVICEIMGEDGTMARLPELTRFAKRHGLRMITIADLIRFRRQSEKLVRRVAEARIPTEFGEFRCIGYESLVDGTEHIAFVKGDVAGKENVLVRVHAEYFVGDVLGFRDHDSRVLLGEALHKIADEGQGVLLYFRRYDGGGASVVDELASFDRQERPAAQSRMDERDYGIGAQILVDLGLTSMRVLSNRPVRRVGLGGYGLSVAETVSLTDRPHARRAVFADLLQGIPEADLQRIDMGD